MGRRHHAGDGEAAIHLEQEIGDAFHRVLASEQQHVIFRMPQLTGRHVPELAGDLDICHRRPAQGCCALPDARSCR